MPPRDRYDDAVFAGVIADGADALAAAQTLHMHVDPSGHTYIITDLDHGAPYEVWEYLLYYK